MSITSTEPDIILEGYIEGDRRDPFTIVKENEIVTGFTYVLELRRGNPEQDLILVTGTIVDDGVTPGPDAIIEFNWGDGDLVEGIHRGRVREDDGAGLPKTIVEVVEVRVGPAV